MIEIAGQSYDLSDPVFLLGAALVALVLILLLLAVRRAGQ